MYIQGSENEAFYGVLVFYVSLRLEKYQNSDITFKNQILKLRIVTAKKKKWELKLIWTGVWNIFSCK